MVQQRPDRLDETRAKQAAAAAWPHMTASERHGVRFGLIPLAVALAAQRTYGTAADGEEFAEFPRLFSVALMGLAEEAAKPEPAAPRAGLHNPDTCRCRLCKLIRST